MLERMADSIGFVDAQPYVDQNVFTSIDPVTGRPEYDLERKPGTGKPATFCPSLWGGKDWPPAAYSPQTGYLYIPANENLCSTIVGREVEYVPGRAFTGASSQVFVVNDAEHLGEIQAWDLATGEQVWTHEFAESQNWGPIMTTGGGLVFAGNTNRRFRAWDAATGEVLWETVLGGPVSGFPVSFAVDGEQYIAVTAGGGDLLSGLFNRLGNLRARGGANMLYAFRLSDSAGRGPIEQPSVTAAAVEPPPMIMIDAPLLEASAPCATFSTEQADRGAALYQEQCAECHGPTLRGGAQGAALAGRSFISYWQDRAASGLYRTVRETMPQGREGTIGPAASADLVAFLLRENGAGATGELGSEVETLDGQRTCFRQ
jgi:mono/diheme cytochrome c family protein